MDRIEVVPNSKREVQFWVSCLDNPNITNENKELINKCLNGELKKLLYPIEFSRVGCNDVDRCTE
jgi:hypothetical protein